MGKLYFLIFVLSLSISYAQEKISGEYKNGFGEKLILYSNHTFEYSWNFDLASSWNIVTWRIKNKDGKYIFLTVKENKRHT